MLLDEQATKSDILDQLERIAKRSQPGDLIILAFSCHGMVSYDDFYLVPHDFNSTRVLSTQGKRILSL